MSVEREYIAGLDIGKLVDFSAFALFERSRPMLAPSGPEVVNDLDELYGQQTVAVLPKPDLLARRPMSGALTAEERRARQWRYHLVRMERWDVGTDYDRILSWLVKAYSRGADRGGLGGTVLAVDYTGVGVPVVEWLRKEMSLAKSTRCTIRPIWIQSGKTVVENAAGGWNVPKSELVSIVQVLLGTKRLTIEQDMKNCGGLVDELLNFKVKQNAETGHESFEAWREKDHDDQVLACAIGLWCGEQKSRDFWVR